VDINREGIRMEETTRDMDTSPPTINREGRDLWRRARSLPIRLVSRILIMKFKMHGLKDLRRTRWNRSH
jgi:hypothetical protein